jgi:ABC-type multidrug transport system fused ATPase/permease subunit
LDLDYHDKVVYQKRRIGRINRLIKKNDQKSRRLSMIRLIIFLLGLVGTFSFYWVDKNISLSILALAVLIFAVAAWIHNRIERALGRSKIWHEFANDRLARLTVDWGELPSAKIFDVDAAHPFDRDISVTGKKSLHHMLDICITQQGSARLADWLLNLRLEERIVHHRQQLVQELKKQRRFRERLRLNFRILSQAQLSGDKVRRWLAATKPTKKLNVLLMIAAALCVINGALVLWSLLGGPAYWGYGLAVYAMFIFYNKDVWFHLGDDAAFLDLEFKQSITIFRYLENFSYAGAPNLATLCTVFRDERTRPTRQLRQFMTLAVFVGFRLNYVTAIALNIFFPYDFLFALLINRQKNKVRSSFDEWLDLLYELDALNALANFADIQDNAVFPNIAEHKQSELSVKNMGHPFIPPQERVCNDFSMQATGAVVLITGSNMSGKSTFLRTIGINLVLAYAGAPVIADDFSASLVRLFCCIQVNDSITDGFSQFYAEVKRLKRLLDNLSDRGERPILYLIDEIFKGTNNRERYIGSRAHIENLRDVNGFGCISTHDLELAQIADIRNVHFREHVEDGKLVFDFKLHDGACPTTNALKIMQLEGLPVDSSK